MPENVLLKHATRAGEHQNEDTGTNYQKYDLPPKHMCDPFKFEGRQTSVLMGNGHLGTAHATPYSRTLQTAFKNYASLLSLRPAMKSLVGLLGRVCGNEHRRVALPAGRP
jgi:hypothetical protein